jgi:IMP dehydrogenase
MRLISAAAIGCKNGEYERAQALVKAGVDLLFLDIANGHMQMAIETTQKLKKNFGKYVEVVSGNVATADGAEQLFKAGADCVKVGIGPGAACITRLQTGAGVPQITAVIETAQVARKYGRTIICDGGTKNTGDIVKGLAAGASAVMVGSLFAGHNESPGKLITLNGKKYKSYNGSASLAEKINHTKKLKGLSVFYTKHIEGIEGMVAYRGPLVNTIETMTANIRSGYSYCGAKNLTELWKKAKFIRVSPLGLRENGAHDVIVR